MKKTQTRSDHGKESVREPTPFRGRLPFFPLPGGVKGVEGRYGKAACAGWRVIVENVEGKESPPLAEELRHQRTGFVGQDTAGDGRLGMEHAGGIHVVAALRVVGAVDQPAQLRPTQRTGAHGARLDGDIERAFVQILAAQRAGCGGDGLHLGMGGDVGQCLGEVVRAGDDAAAADDDRAYGHFAAFGSQPGFGQRLLHVEDVFVHGESASHVVFVEERGVVFFHRVIDEGQHCLAHPPALVGDFVFSQVAVDDGGFVFAHPAHHAPGTLGLGRSHFHTFFNFFAHNICKNNGSSVNRKV